MIVDSRHHIVGGVVAGIVLLVIPALANLIAGTSVKVPFWVWIALVGIVVLTVAAARAITWIRTISRNLANAQKDIADLKRETDFLTRGLSLEDAKRIAGQAGWTVEISPEGMGYHLAKCTENGYRVQVSAGLEMGSDNEELAAEMIEQVLVSSIVNNVRPARLPELVEVVEQMPAPHELPSAASRARTRRTP